MIKSKIIAHANLESIFIHVIMTKMAGLYHDLCMNYILFAGSVYNLEATDIPDVLKSAEHVHVSPMLYINMDWNIDQLRPPSHKSFSLNITSFFLSYKM